MLALQVWVYYFKIAFKKEIVWKHYLLLEALQFTSRNEGKKESFQDSKKMGKKVDIQNST